jgi:hypothetical protein
LETKKDQLTKLKLKNIEKNDKNSEKESDAENKLDNESEIKKYFERFKNADEGDIPVLKGESEK